MHEDTWIPEVKVIFTFVQSIRRTSSTIFSNIFSSETTGTTTVKFHVVSPWDGETKVCSNDSGYMTKIAARSLYGKNL